MRRLVHAVVGAADALGQPAGALRRADMDDEVDIAPVDAEIERRGGDDGAQAVGLHRLLDAPALADIERAVMQRDRQRVLVDAPELLEQQLGLAARVDEQQRRPVLLDRLVDFGHGVARRMARPTARAPRESRMEMIAAWRRRSTVMRSAMVAGAGFCADQPAAQLVRLGDRRRQADRLQAGHELAQPRQAERQQMAALGGDQRMQLVEDDIAQVLEEALGVRRGDQQRQLLRRGQQDVGRVELLALALVRRRVAGAGLDRDAAGPSRRPACRDCARCRRPAPSAARCRACGCRDAPRPACASAASARSVSDGRKPASVLPAPVGAISSTDLPACALPSSSIWCARGDQPRSANHFRNGSGRMAAAVPMSARASVGGAGASRARGSASAIKRQANLEQNGIKL